MKNVFEIKLLNGTVHKIESDSNCLSDISLDIMRICVDNNSQVVSLNELTANHRNINK